MNYNVAEKNGKVNLTKHDICCLVAFVRLHDVMHSERRLTLVFEYCDQVKFNLSKIINNIITPVVVLCYIHVLAVL